MQDITVVCNYTCSVATDMSILYCSVNRRDMKLDLMSVSCYNKRCRLWVKMQWNIYPISINVQHDAAICRLLFSVTLLDMFRVSSTHHQEYQKLYLRPLVHVIVLVPLPADSVAWSGWVLDTRNMSSSVTENKSLHIAASCWTFIDIEAWCTEPWV